VQHLLGSDEALLFFLTGRSETHVWAVTREGVAWHHTALGDDELARRVRTLRVGVELENQEAAVAAGKGFDLAAAADLYAFLFDGIEAKIRDKKHLIIVPSAALTSLPFQLLVTASPAVAKPNVQQLSAYREAAWLIKRHDGDTSPLSCKPESAAGARKAQPRAKASGRLWRSHFWPRRPRRSGHRGGAFSHTYAGFLELLARDAR
jgi:hypothetical protein